MRHALALLLFLSAGGLGLGTAACMDSGSLGIGLLAAGGPVPCALARQLAAAQTGAERRPGPDRCPNRCPDLSTGRAEAEAVADVELVYACLGFDCSPPRETLAASAESPGP
ncbi:MAG: hypothetical protein AAF682_09535 [Planctomycetota bacterium]